MGRTIYSRYFLTNVLHDADRMLKGDRNSKEVIKFLEKKLDELKQREKQEFFNVVYD